MYVCVCGGATVHAGISAGDFLFLSSLFHFIHCGGY